MEFCGVMEDGCWRISVSIYVLEGLFDYIQLFSFVMSNGASLYQVIRFIYGHNVGIKMLLNP